MSDSLKTPKQYAHLHRLAPTQFSENVSSRPLNALDIGEYRKRNELDRTLDDYDERVLKIVSERLRNEIRDSSTTIFAIDSDVVMSALAWTKKDAYKNTFYSGILLELLWGRSILLPGSLVELLNVFERSEILRPRNYDSSMANAFRDAFRNRKTRRLDKSLYAKVLSSLEPSSEEKNIIFLLESLAESRTLDVIDALGYDEAVFLRCCNILGHERRNYSRNNRVDAYNYATCFEINAHTVKNGIRVALVSNTKALNKLDDDVNSRSSEEYTPYVMSVQQALLYIILKKNHVDIVDAEIAAWQLRQEVHRLRGMLRDEKSLPEHFLGALKDGQLDVDLRLVGGISFIQNVMNDAAANKKARIQAFDQRYDIDGAWYFYDNVKKELERIAEKTLFSKTVIEGRRNISDKFLIVAEPTLLDQQVDFYAKMSESGSDVVETRVGSVGVESDAPHRIVCVVQGALGFRLFVEEISHLITNLSSSIIAGEFEKFEDPADLSLDVMFLSQHFTDSHLELPFGPIESNELFSKFGYVNTDYELKVCHIDCDLFESSYEGQICVLKIHHRLADLAYDFLDKLACTPDRKPVKIPEEAFRKSLSQLSIGS